MMVFEVIRFSLRQHLGDQQHGFMVKKSTSMNLLSYSAQIHQSLENGMEVDCIYTDFTKAFDKISHQVIVEKLSKIGFGGNLLCWLQSFLSNRKYAVRFGNSSSFEFMGTSGVPAGTHGGPICFWFSLMISRNP
jgi:hypothetical protein